MEESSTQHTQASTRVPASRAREALCEAKGADCGHLPSRGDFSSAFLSSSASMTSSAKETQPQAEAFLSPLLTRAHPPAHGSSEAPPASKTLPLSPHLPEAAGAHS